MKNNVTRITLLLGSLLFAWPSLGSAAIPEGTMVFQFTDDNIYDFSQFQDCESAFGISLCLDVDMMPNGKGKHSGNAIFDFSGPVNGSLSGPASGSVSGKTGDKGAARLKLSTAGKLHFAGAGTFKSWIDIDCSGKITVTGYHKLKCQLEIRVKGYGTERDKAKYFGQLNGGPWSLTIDMKNPSGNKLTGNGSDSLGYLYKLKGNYDAKKDMAEVDLTGRKKNASKGAWVKLKKLTDTGDSKAKFKVQGYKGGAKVQAEPP